VSRRTGGWSAAAGVCAVAALGLPWSLAAPGAATPVRVFVVLAVVLVVVGRRTGRDRLLSLAVLVGLAGVLLGGLSPTPGAVALAVAVGCLAAGLRADGRPVLPHRTSGRTGAGPAPLS
jgi:hypothetical protein